MLVAIELKNENNASPAITPPANTSITELPSGPRAASQICRKTIPSSTAQPANGAAISSPVANSSPSWRFWPPSSCSNAPGIAQIGAEVKDHGILYTTTQAIALGQEVRRALAGSFWGLREGDYPFLRPVQRR